MSNILPFMSPSRCVLVLGDEGLQVYNVTSMRARLVDVLPWNTEDFEVSVSDLIVRKCGKKPVVILNDMVEQHYRKERIPRVSPMDRANVVQRRLNVAFPNYPVRAALKLNDKNLPKSKVSSGGLYLFAAVPATEAFRKTMEAVRRSMAPIVGFYLLPVESSDMVQTLSRKLVKRGQSKAIWTIFVGQHHSGGLRQIVTRNGELALTRMTPIIDTDIEPDVWAREVASEFQATMSYLSRFGYEASDGLNVVVVCNEAAGAVLEGLIDVECNLNLLQADEVGGLLGLKIGKQDDLRYADPIHAAWLGKKSKFILPMQATQLSSVSKPRRIAMLAALIMMLGVAYFAFQIFVDTQRWLVSIDDLDSARQQQRSVQQVFEQEVEKKKALGFDFVLINNSLKVFDSLEKGSMKPLPMFRDIGRSLGPDLHINAMSVNRPTSLGEGAAKTGQYQYDSYGQETKEEEVDQVFETVFTISFPQNIEPEVGVRKVNQVKDRLQQSLPQHEIRIMKQVADLSYTGNFVGEAGDAGTGSAGVQDFDAEIMVKGTLK